MEKSFIEKYNKLVLDHGELKKAIFRFSDPSIEKPYSIYHNTFNDFMKGFSEFKNSLSKAYALAFRLAFELPEKQLQSRHQITIRITSEEYTRPLARYRIAEQLAQRCLLEGIELNEVWVAKQERYGSYEITFYIL